MRPTKSAEDCIRKAIADGELPLSCHHQAADPRSGLGTKGNVLLGYLQRRREEKVSYEHVIRGNAPPFHEAERQGGKCRCKDAYW
jgi:hypothetical protein